MQVASEAAAGLAMGEVKANQVAQGTDSEA